MKLETFLNQIQCRITGGSKFLWTCYGENSWCLESASGHAVIDCLTHMVYEIEICNVDGKSYKWVDPDFVDVYVKESNRLGFDPWIAYDDVKFEQITNSKEILDLID